MGSLTDYRLPGDLALFHALNGLPAPLARSVCLASDRIFGLACLGAALAFVAWRERQAWLPNVLAVIGAVGATDLVGARLLKPLCHRLRPCDVLPPGTFHPWLSASRGGSLPSLHAADAFAAAFVVSRLLPRSWPWVYLAAVLIALSRPVGGVHWPSDTLAGAAFGTLVGALAVVLLRRYRAPLAATA
ncbi:MAG TPA: phosphatase PAP2 family protein [Myxococcales bacterium]|nr:phosphatase PAP2 family protein [Myxococcales bacterium]